MSYTPKQNGAAEEENHTIVESALSMLTPVDCRKNCGLEACNNVVYVLHCTEPIPVESKDAFGTVDWIICNSWSLGCFWDKMLCAHSQTEKAQVVLKEYIGLTGQIYG